MDINMIWLFVVILAIVVIAYFVWRSNSDKPEQMEDHIERKIDEWKNKRK